MGKPKKKYNGTYGRMLALAAHALAEVFLLLLFKLVFCPSAFHISNLNRKSARDIVFVRGKTNSSQKSCGENQRTKLWLGSLALINVLGSQTVSHSFSITFVLRKFTTRAKSVFMILFWVFFLVELDGKNGYIMVTANGGINQQRVAVSWDCYTHFPVQLL